MNPESQAALAALEQELERLRSAVEHIEQAKTVAQKVIGAVVVIQRKYGEHLDALLEVQKEAVREAGSVQQVRFDELGASARRHILESAARAKKYLEEYNADVLRSIGSAGDAASASMHDVALKAGGVIESTGSQLQLQLQTLLDGVEQRIETMNTSAQKLIEQSGSSADRHIDAIAGKAAAAVEGLDARARAHVEEVGVLAKSNLHELLKLSKESIEEAGNHSKRIFAAIKKGQDQQTTEFEKVTVSADALIAASGKLVRTIDGIDFPARLQSIESDVRSLHYNFNSAMNHIDALGKSNEQAMAAFSDDTVAKLGRLEMFTEKAVRSHSDEVGKRFTEQEAQVGKLRLLLIVVMVINILIAAGTYLVWSGSQAPAPASVPQIVHDTVYVPTPPVVEEKRKTRRR